MKFFTPSGLFPINPPHTSIIGPHAKLLLRCTYIPVPLCFRLAPLKDRLPLNNRAFQLLWFATRWCLCRFPPSSLSVILQSPFLITKHWISGSKFHMFFGTRLFCLVRFLMYVPNHILFLPWFYLSPLRVPSGLFVRVPCSASCLGPPQVPPFSWKCWKWCPPCFLFFLLRITNIAPFYYTPWLPPWPFSPPPFCSWSPRSHAPPRCLKGMQRMKVKTCLYLWW